MHLKENVVPQTVQLTVQQDSKSLLFALQATNIARTTCILNLLNQAKKNPSAIEILHDNDN